MNVSISARGGCCSGRRSVVVGFTRQRLSSSSSISSSSSSSLKKMFPTTTTTSSPFSTTKNTLSFLHHTPSRSIGGRFGLLRHSPNNKKNRFLRSFSSSTTTTSLSSSSSTTNKSTTNDVSSSWSLSIEDELYYKEHGILDERGLTQFNTLHEMIMNSTTVFKDRPLFGTYNDTEQKKEFTWMSYKEYSNKIHQCREVLYDLGVREHSKVGIISNNRWEWATIAGACYSMNANLVPMYEAQLPVDWSYIVNDASIEVLVCATEDIYQRVQEYVIPNSPTLHTTLSLENHQEEYGFSKLMSKYENVNVEGTNQNSNIVKPPTPDDLANLIYTSGTTGKPKGVELTHMNITSNVKGAPRTMIENPNDLICPDDCSLSFLPWAHSYGQTCELFMSMSHGSSMGICRGVPYILEDIQMIQPTILFAVPTLYKKIYDGVTNVIETSTPIRKRLMQQALYLGDKHVQCIRNNNNDNNDNNNNDGLPKQQQQQQLSFMERIQFRILDSLILSKIRNRFGGRLRHSFVAGAACPAEVLHFMDSIGIPVCEGYGLTETSPIIAINTPNQRQIGSVGKPIGDVQVYIVNPETNQEVPMGEEGEICCIGPNVMRGYHNNVEATNEVITYQSPVVIGGGSSSSSSNDEQQEQKVRMFHTGDVGCIDNNGYVKVTGRIKEQYKLENGKYIVPTPIEETIAMSRFIHQVVIYGANRPYNVAIIVPELITIRQELNIQSQKTDDELMNDTPRIHELIQTEIANACLLLKKFEIPKKYIFVAPFTSANNMLTPKMSIRRHKVIAEYMNVLEPLYNNNNNNNSNNDNDKKGTKKDDDQHHEQQEAAA